MSGRVSKGEYELLAAFRYALRQFLHFSEAAAGAAGLTPQQHQALLAIMGFPGRAQVTIGELADRLYIRHHSAVGLVNRLTTLGLVQRELGPSDRRQVYVRLTPHGMAILEQLSTVHREEISRIGPHLRTLLERLTGTVREEGPS
ncbi:MAG: MarR family winged helix-turn-helix transcriptional regulator [Candidatus Tectimicrobiota bacterium]